MKNKLWYRAISVFLAVMTLLTILPLNIFALEDDTQIAEQNISVPSTSTDSGEKATLSTEPTVNTLTYAKWDGSVASSLSGKGTEASPYIITNGAELSYFAAQVSIGNTYEGKHIHLKTNIDMDMFNNGKTWTPIGSSVAPFMGTFDGECHEIINLNIKYDARSTDSTVSYVGFFGYVKNATIKNFGIYNYKIDQKYYYDTEIGAMVAHAAESSTITNCYANGDISAMFEDSNPLYRDNVLTLDYVPENLEDALTNSGMQIDPNGQGVIMDLRNASWAVNKTMKITGNVSALKIIGNPNTTYVNFEIDIGGNTNFDFYLELVNVSMVGDIEEKGRDEHRDIYVCSSGSKNSIVGKEHQSAINAPNSNVYICGEAALNICGGKGTNGANATATAAVGSSGTAGAVGVQAKSLCVNTSSAVTISGGVGGTGGMGGTGKSGSSGSNGDGDIWNQQSKPVKTAESGGTGGTGGAGGNGGAGGVALNQECEVIVASGSLSLISGAGGNGGAGGVGGKGGTGGAGGDADKGSWMFGMGWTYGANGGKGGTGGTGGAGGNGGAGGAALTYTTKVYSGASFSSSGGKHGVGGAGGKGGAGGTGGLGGSCDGTVSSNGCQIGGQKCTCGGRGGNGGTGGVGGAGGNGSTAGIAGSSGAGGAGGIHSTSKKVCYCVGNSSPGGTNSAGAAGKVVGNSPASTTIKGTLSSFDAPVLKLSKASAFVGGIIGCLDSKARSEYCASVNHEDITVTALYDYNSTACGYLIGNQQGTIINAISARDSNGVLFKNENIDSWFGLHTDNRADFPVSVLNAYADNIGLVYDNGITADNTVSQVRSVVDKIGEKCAVVIPDYVFSGRFITAVTSIAPFAFADNSLITNVTCGAKVETICDYSFQNSSITQIITGDTVVSIGEKAFAQCGQLTKADLGKSVSDISEKIFAGCYSLVEIIIGESLETIPEIKTNEFLFGLDKFIENELDDGNVSYDGKHGCSLAKYTVDPNNKKFASDDYGILYEKMTIPFNSGDKDVLVSVIDAPKKSDLTNYQIPDHIVRIEDYAFAYTNVKNVFVAGVRDIGNKAFLGCSNLVSVLFEVPSADRQEFVNILDDQIVVPEVKYSQSIGIQAFALCTSLENVTLESPYITAIGSGAFADCGDKIETIMIGSSIMSIGDRAFTSLGNGKTATGIRWFNVSDGNRWFCSMEGVLYQKLPDGTYALLMYPILKLTTSYTIPTDITVSKVLTGAFRYAAYLEHVNLNNVKIIEDYALANTNIITVYMGESITQLGTKPNEGIYTIFAECGYLSAIYVDENNANYSNLEDDGVLYSEDIKTIYKYPAQKRGEEFYIPESVTYISSLCFKGASNLQRIVVSSDVEAIGQEAFYDCQALLAIYFKDTDAPIVRKSTSPNVFNTGNDRTYIFYTTKGYVQNSNNWDYFIREYKEEYNIAECKTIPDLDDYKEKEYYAIVVVDKLGLPINGVAVKLTLNDGDTNEENDITDSDITKEGIRILTDTSDQLGGFVIDYTKSYTLVVVDPFGEYYPTENAEFYLDEATRITYITLSSVPTVSGVKVSYDVKSADKIKKILTDDAAAAIVGDGYKVVDINSETAKINTWCVEEINILVNCGMDIDTEVVGFHLVQDGKEIKIVTDPETLQQMLDYKSGGGKRFAELNFSVETADLEKEKDVYIIVEFSDGNQVQTKLNIHVFELNFYKIDMPFLNNNDALTLTIAPELMNILKGFGTELSFDLPKNHKIVVDSESDKFKIAIAYGDDVMDGFGFSEINENNLGEFFKNWNTYLNAFKKGGKLYEVKKIPYELENKFETKFNLCGFAEIKYKGLDENGEPDIAVESGVTGTIKFVYNFAHTVKVVVVPVRVEAELSASGSLTFKLVWDKEAASLCTGNIDLTIKGYFELSAGVGCALASVGVYGSAETIFVLNLAPDFEVKKWTLEGDVGVYVKYSGLFIKWKKTWSILKGLGIDAEWVIYEDGKWWYEADGQVASISEVSLANAVYDESAYAIATSSFDPEVMTFSLGGIQEKQQNAYSGIAPKMIQVGDLIYIVYHDDLARYNADEEKYYYTSYKDSYNFASYDKFNYQKLVYQIYDTKNKTLSDVVVLDDNGLADGSYEVFYNGTDAVVVYTQLNKKLTTDNIDDMAGYVGALEVKTAVLKNGVFEASPNTLTSNEYYDMNLRVGEVDGKITAVWVQNAENTMFGTTDNNNQSVMFSVYDGETWSTPAYLKSNINTITDIEIGNKGVVYITDTNNDITTIGSDKITEGYSDRLIYHISKIDKEENQNEENFKQLTAEESEYHDVSYFGDEVVYYSGNNLYSIDTTTTTIKACFDEAIAELTEDYTVLTDGEGNVKAILFVSNTTYPHTPHIGEDGYWWVGDINTYVKLEEGKLVEGDNHNWWIDYTGELLENYDTGISVSEDGSNIFAVFCDGDKWGAPIQLTDFGEEVFVSAFDAADLDDKMLISVLLSEIEYSEESTDEYDNYITTNRFETLEINYPTDYVMGEVSFDYESISPGNETTLTIYITNNGYKTLTSVPVSVKRVGGNDIISKTVSVFYDAEGAELSDGLLPGTSGYIKVEFNVGEENGDPEYTVNVNGQTQNVQLWYSDFAVFGKQILIGDTYHIVARVTNNGHVPAAYTLTAMLGDQEVYSQLTNVLEHGETQYFTIPLENTVADDGSALVFVRVIADDEYMLSNNEAKINIAANEILTISTDSLSVKLSKTTATIYRSELENIDGITFDNHFTLVSATVNDVVIANSLYSVSNSSITLNANAFASEYQNGTYTIKFKFSDGSLNDNGNAVYKYATFVLTITQKFTATWVVDGVVVETEKYVLGSKPERAYPEKAADAQYKYECIGWDSNGDGAPDEITAIEVDTTYVAIFSSDVNSYKVVWEVNGELSDAQTYVYGAMPSYDGVPTKPSDAQFDYVFAGWDKQLAAVKEDVKYVAVFNAVVRKYTITTVVDGVSTTMQVEYGAVPELSDPTKESDVQYSYSFAGWTPAVSAVYGNQTYTAQFDSIVRQYVVTWIVDGAQTRETYDYGTLPMFNGTPAKQGNKQYSYSFAGWDKEITNVSGDVTYTAQFNEAVNYYTISFVVNGTTYQEQYEYGAVPSYRGDTAKPADETYRYVFSGWDKDIVAVSEDATYVAQYDAFVIGSATISNTQFKTAWNCEFTTTISLSNIHNMTETSFTIYYNTLIVDLKSYNCYEGATVTATGTGSITVQVNGLIENASRNVLDITFVTNDNVAFGESHFIDITAEDNITSALGNLTIYKMGDVNMDGRVNTVDAAMIQRYAVKKLEMNPAQMVYGNVNGDVNADGTEKINTIDAAMVQRYAVKKIDSLGNRITVSFDDGEDVVSMTLVKGSNVDYEPVEGYAWSLSKDQLVSVDFTALTSDTTVYMIKK